MHSAGPRRGLARIKPRLYYSPSPSDAGAGAAECESRAAKEAGGVCGDGRAALCAPGGDGGTAGCHAALPCTCNVPGPGRTGPGPVCVKPSRCAVESGRRAQRDRAAHACGAPTAPALRTVPGGAGPAGPGPGLRGPLVCRAPVSLRPAPPLPWDSCAAHAARRESRAEGAEEGNPR